MKDKSKGFSPTDLVAPKPENFVGKDPWVVIAGLCEIIEKLLEENSLLREENRALKEEIKDLKSRLNMDSHNSNKPPSSDGFKKVKSLRKPTGRPSGGQPGHEGYTLKMVEVPHKTVPHRVTSCSCCGASLSEVEVKGCKKAQVFDLPPMELFVTEHQAESKDCPFCGVKNEAEFPEGIVPGAQYGTRIKAFATYLNQYQHIPYDRTCELISDIFSHPISEGTLDTAVRGCCELLEGFEVAVKDQISKSDVVGFDETGASIKSERCWVHVASTPTLTFYVVHPERGRNATEYMGILPNFHGTAVHDSWGTYSKYPCSHALCNGHHLRELTFARDDEKRYDRIIRDALNSLPLNEENIEKRQGRKKQSKTKNLLDRLIGHKDEVLAFMYDFSIPFDNNGAERDLRMVKLKEKISGTFRSVEGAKAFCRIRSYISTVKKHGMRVIDEIQRVFLGQPFMPICRAGPE
ncbi:IS66 family transposase [Candidatus Woesearchaeota archaeon]|nr:IS66 family transposase [Candidatus Woesearchaeota archaeon]